MRFVLFYHAFASCWNHGNAHFLRGIARELITFGHEVILYEPADGWSRTNALADGGDAALAEAAQLVPGLILRTYKSANLDFDAALDHADVVIAHEWTDRAVIAALNRRRRAGRFLLLFHDTHHRAVTKPQDIDDLPLGNFDGVLAFGAVLREIYAKGGWGGRAFTWHEAADVALFHPQPATSVSDLIWIGNWGDDERAAELHRFLLKPVAALGITARVHGVRYPAEAQALLQSHGLAYKGWLPNHRAPAAYGRARVTVHIPRRPYVEALPGIPTIRVFEALACGIPLICSPWQDEENLFAPESFATARNSKEMAAALKNVLNDRALADAYSRQGLSAIRDRHTCAHRVEELMDVLCRLGAPAAHRVASIKKDQVSAS
jgi:spore maturation protein CgeB